MLLALQQAGNVLYIRKVIRFDCAAGQRGEELKPHLRTQLVAELQAFAKEKENALGEWETAVKQCRRTHYDLNYFTTLQLLRLRKELGFVRQNPHKPVDPEILTLLQSISPYVTYESVQNAIKNLILASNNEACTSVAPSAMDMELPELELTSSYDCQALPGSTDSMQLDSTPGSPHHISFTSDWYLPGNTEPLLRKKDLDGDKLKILVDLVETYHFPEILVLKAIDECPENANKYDIQDWCEENLYDGPDVPIEDVSSDESISDDECVTMFTPAAQDPKSFSSGV